MRVVCAMSGGVDSSVAAALMVEAGHEVIGMTMNLYDASGQRSGRGGTCCSPAEVDLARQACELLGVPHYTVDERKRFREHVIDDFVREYSSGRTPNPCARCNEHVKFGPLLERARALGAERLITGHYARVVDGELHRGVDPAKDQSYFLFAMGRNALEHVDFPLGDWTKEQVRERARALGMPNADAPDSQELCFVPSGDHGDVVEARAREMGLDPASLQPGPIEDDEGNTIGRHAGIHRVTVGQRRGIGLSSDRPRYVLRVLPQTHTVVMGDKTSLDRDSLVVDDFRALVDPAAWAELAESGLRAQVQIRHRSPARPAMVRGLADDLSVRFDEPVRAVAPGQAAVFYQDAKVLGGGWIR